MSTKRPLWAPYFIIALLALAPVAHADQVILNSNAGTGNQPWTVPSDFNTTQNSVSCSGIGTTTQTSEANIPLSPDSTVTYAIGSSATSTLAGSTDTYFNGTSSTTASVTCPEGNEITSTSTGSISISYTPVATQAEKTPLNKGILNLLRSIFTIL